MGHPEAGTKAEGQDVVDRPGIDRRTLIRRAAVTGAVAWTAPVIIGSLTSPAAAVTGIVGCTGVKINGSCSDDNQATPCSFPLCDSTNASQILECLTIPSDCDGKPGAVTFTIDAGCTTCVFSDAIAKAGSDCVTPSGIGTDTIIFPLRTDAPNNQPPYGQFAINITCT